MNILGETEVNLKVHGEGLVKKKTGFWVILPQAKVGTPHTSTPPLARILKLAPPPLPLHPCKEPGHLDTLSLDFWPPPELWQTHGYFVDGTHGKKLVQKRLKSLLPLPRGSFWKAASASEKQKKWFPLAFIEEFLWWINSGEWDSAMEATSNKYFFPSFPSIYGRENHDNGNSYVHRDRVLGSRAWPQTMHSGMTMNICPSAFTFWVLACGTIPRSRSASQRSQGCMHAKQAPYQLHYTPKHRYFNNKKDLLHMPTLKNGVVFGDWFI